MKSESKLKKLSKTVAGLLILAGGNYLSFKSGVWFEGRHEYATRLAQFAYQVGYRDGREEQLALDKHDADKAYIPEPTDQRDN